MVNLIIVAPLAQSLGCIPTQHREARISTANHLGANKYVCQAFPVRNWQGTNLKLLREENLGLAAKGILRKDLLRYRDLKDSEEQRREEKNRL